MYGPCKFPIAMVLISFCGAGPVSAGQQGQSPVPAAPAAATINVPSDYLVGPEDVLGILFWRDQDMTGEVTVRPDGKITLPLIGDVQAAGLKPQALRDEIQKAAGKYLTDVNVTVIVRQINSRKVFITGQVTNPGAYPLAGPRTVMQVIALAGGLTEYADSKGITIMRTEGDQTRSYRFNYREVAKGKGLAQNILLKPGDTIVVP